VQPFHKTLEAVSAWQRIADMVGALAPWLRQLYGHRWVIGWHRACAVLVCALACFPILYLLPVYTRLDALVQGAVVLIPTLTLAAHAVMWRERLRPSHLSRVQHALAGGDEEVGALPGRLCWSHAPDLAPRKESARVLQLWQQGASVVLLEGYAASGKSSVALHAAAEVVGRGSLILPSYVYYASLSTRAGCVPSRDVDAIFSAVETDLRRDSRGALVYAIVEDVHLAPEMIEVFRQFMNRRNIRLLLTSRRLPECALPRSVSGRQPDAELEDPWYWVPTSNRVAMDTDLSVVCSILAHQGVVRCGNLDSLASLIGAREPNLLLVAFAIHAAKRSSRSLDDLTAGSLREYIRSYWRSIGKDTATPADLFRLLGPLAVLSEVDVPASAAFVAEVGELRGEKAQSILSELARIRIVSEVVSAHPSDAPRYVIAHSRLAGIYREAWVDPSLRTTVVLEYIARGESAGYLAGRLAAEDRAYWDDIALDAMPIILKRGFTSISPKEIGDLLHALPAATKHRSQKFAVALEKELPGLDLAQSELPELGRLMSGILRVAPDLGPKVQLIYADLVAEKMRHANPPDLQRFLGGLAPAARGTARWFIENSREAVLGLDVKNLKAAELGALLGTMTLVSHELAEVFVAQHRQLILSQAVSGLTPAALGRYLGSLAVVSSELAGEFAKLHRRDILRVRLEGLLPPIVGRFLASVSSADRDLAKELCDRNAELLLGLDISELTAPGLARYLGRLAAANRDLAALVASRHQGVILRTACESMESRRILGFLTGVAAASAEVAAAFARRHRDTLARLVGQLKLPQIGVLLALLLRLPTDVYMDMLDTHAEVIDDKIRASSPSDLTGFLSKLVPLGGAQVAESLSGHLDTLEASMCAVPDRDQLERLLLVASYVLPELAASVARRRGVAIAQPLPASSAPSVPSGIDRFIVLLDSSSEEAIEALVRRGDEIADLIEITDDIDRMGTLFSKLSDCSPALANELALDCQDALLAKTLVDGKPGSIARYLAGIGAASATLAQRIVEHQAEPILESLSVGGPSSLGGFLQTIARSAPVVAEGLANRLRPRILALLSADQSPLAVAELLTGAAIASRPLSRQVTTERSQILVDLLQGTLGQHRPYAAGALVHGIYRAHPQFARDLVCQERARLMDISLKESNAQGIGRFLHALITVDRPLAVEFIRLRREQIDGILGAAAEGERTYLLRALRRIGPECVSELSRWPSHDTATR